MKLKFWVKQKQTKQEKKTMQNPTTRPITDAQDVYDFLRDANEQRQREIQMEDIVSHISRSNQLNWN